MLTIPPRSAAIQPEQSTSAGYSGTAPVLYLWQHRSAGVQSWHSHQPYFAHQGAATLQPAAALLAASRATTQHFTSASHFSDILHLCCQLHTLCSSPLCDAISHMLNFHDSGEKDTAFLLHSLQLSPSVLLQPLHLSSPHIPSPSTWDTQLRTWLPSSISSLTDFLHIKVSRNIQDCWLSLVIVCLADILFLREPYESQHDNEAGPSH